MALPHMLFVLSCGVEAHLLHAEPPKLLASFVTNIWMSRSNHYESGQLQPLWGRLCIEPKEPQQIPSLTPKVMIEKGQTHLKNYNPA